MVLCGTVLLRTELDKTGTILRRAPDMQRMLSTRLPRVLMQLCEDDTLEAKSMDSGIGNARIGTPTLLLSSCVTLDNRLSLSELVSHL